VSTSTLGHQKTPFGEWADRWLDTRNNLKPKSMDGYESLLRVRILPRFGRTPLRAIDYLDVEAFIAELTESGLSPSRIRQVHQLLSMILKSAVRSRRIGINPAEGAPLPRTNKRPMRSSTPTKSHASPTQYPTATKPGCTSPHTVDSAGLNLSD
jgi:hypothetical protein